MCNLCSVGVPAAVYWSLKANLDKVRSIIFLSKQPEGTHKAENHFEATSQNVTQPEFAASGFAVADTSKAQEEDMQKDVDSGKSHDLVEANFGFLFVGYHEDCYYWEVMVMIRKAILSIIAVIFAFDGRVQVMLGMLLLFLSTIAQARKMPFASSFLNSFEFASLFSSSMTFFLGIFTMDSGASGAAYPICSQLALIINVGYVLIAFFFGVKLELNERKRQEEKKKRETARRETMIKAIENSSQHKSEQIELTSLSNASDRERLNVRPVEDSPSRTAESSTAKEQHVLQQQALLAETTLETSACATDMKVVTSKKKMVIALKSFVAKKPTQLSFGVGDVIKVIKAEGPWHAGILVSSATQPITSRVLYYPPGFVKPYEGATGIDVTFPANTISKPPTDLVISSKSIGDAVDLSAVTSKKKMVIALKSFEAIKPNQLSFGVGDVIQVIKAEGKWHTGILVSSATQPITSRVLYYPPNLVRPHEEVAAIAPSNQTANSGEFVHAAVSYEARKLSTNNEAKKLRKSISDGSSSSRVS